MAEKRIGAKLAAEILGCSLRTLQMRSARGEVPSAARVFGTKWSYDPVALREFVRLAEDRAARPQQAHRDRTAEPFSVEDPSIVEAYEKLIGSRRRRNDRRG